MKAYDPEGQKFQELVWDLEKRLPKGDYDLESLENVTSEMQVAIDHGLAIVTADRNNQPPLEGMLMLGAPSIGKTHLMAALCRIALQHRKRVQWWNFPYLADEFWGSFKQHEHRMKLINSFKRRDVVFFDDIGQEDRWESVDKQLYKVFDLIYERGIPLIGSTNLTLKGYEQEYTPAIRERIAGVAALRIVTGESWRRKRGKKFKKFEE